MWPSWDKPLPYILCHNSSLKYPDNSTSSIYLRFSDAKTTTKCQKLTTWWWKAGSTQTHWCLRRGHHQPKNHRTVREEITHLGTARPYPAFKYMLCWNPSGNSEFSEAQATWSLPAQPCNKPFTTCNSVSVYLVSLLCPAHELACVQ